METTYEGLHRLTCDHLRSNPTTDMFSLQASLESTIGRPLDPQEGRVFPEVLRELVLEGLLRFGGYDMHGIWVEVSVT